MIIELDFLEGTKSKIKLDVVPDKNDILIIYNKRFIVIEKRFIINKDNSYVSLLLGRNFD